MVKQKYYLIFGIIIICTAVELILLAPLVSGGTTDELLKKCDVSGKKFERTEIGDIIVYWHQRMIGDAIVEKDYINCQFDKNTGELIKKTVRWREDLPEHITTNITKEQAESMVKGEVQFSELYIISPDSDVFLLDSTPENPCWVVRSTENSNGIVTIIDAVDGKILGHGVPPPPSTEPAPTGPTPTEEIPPTNRYTSSALIIIGIIVAFIVGILLYKKFKKK